MTKRICIICNEDAELSAAWTACYSCQSVMCLDCADGRMWCPACIAEQDAEEDEEP